jgi:hypothetical protein
MDQAVTRAAGATPITTPPIAAARRSWAILLTSANHGVDGPLGSTFPHAGEKHERVVVVEVPAAAGAPSDEVNLVLRTASEAEASAGTVSTDERAAFERQERGSNLRRVGVDRDGSGGWYENPCVQSAWEGWQARSRIAAQAGQVAVPEGWLYECVQPGTDGYVWSEFFSRIEPMMQDGVRNIKPVFAAAPSAPAVAQQAPAEPGWISVDERLPSVPENSDRQFIVACRRANGKTYVFAASYLNAMELDANDDGDAVFTGWYTEGEHPEYSSWYEPVCQAGDEVTHWQELPAAPSPAKESK